MGLIRKQRLRLSRRESGWKMVKLIKGFQLFDLAYEAVATLCRKRESFSTQLR